VLARDSRGSQIPPSVRDFRAALPLFRTAEKEVVV